jgi:mono/diheme cytochrome c family protein
MSTSTRWTPLLVLIGLATLGCGEQREVPLTGQILYVRHCASCHGPDGEGDGPLAASLKRPPADLTRLAERDGRFDEARVMQAIDGRREVTEHGPREMPVWGAVFADDLGEERWGFYTAMLHARALTDYLRSIQRPRGAPDEPAAGR